MHLVIATREDPPLPLARLRARGQLTELRATDLRFTPSEAADFLNQVMGLDLSAGEVASLETRTEGWIAGLQLAALLYKELALCKGRLQRHPMQGREDVSRFIRAFAGANRYIVDYLVEEVLQRQPEGVRSFLLQTSILDRLSGPLCDAVRFGSEKPPSGQEEGNILLRHWSAATCSSSRWMTSANGIAITIFLQMFCRQHLMEEQPDRSSHPASAGERVVRAERICPPMRSATRLPQKISSERQTWPSWHGQHGVGVFSRSRGLAG